MKLAIALVASVGVCILLASNVSVGEPPPVAPYDEHVLPGEMACSRAYLDRLLVAVDRLEDVERRARSGMSGATRAGRRALVTTLDDAERRLMRIHVEYLRCQDVEYAFESP